MFIAWAMCGLTHVTTVAALCSSCSLLCISNSDLKTENEAGRSVSVNGNEEPAGEICYQYSSVVNCNYSLIKHNKTPVHSTLGLLRVCVCVWPARLPVLNWVPSSVPPPVTIFKIGSPAGPRRIQHDDSTSNHSNGLTQRIQTMFRTTATFGD